ncbi:MAG: hypothetical protein RI907_3480 [Pseudomonadota bacterium]|jgi:cytochrome bd-type quinol oxidase subunit 2
MTFEKLSFFLTGVRCEPTPRGRRIRVTLGLVWHVGAFALVGIFMAGGAGNANASMALWPRAAAMAVLLIAYLATTIVLAKRGHHQASQYAAWSPSLVAVILLVGHAMVAR